MRECPLRLGDIVVVCTPKSGWQICFPTFYESELLGERVD